MFICSIGCVQPPPEATGGLEIVVNTLRGMFGYGFESMITYGCEKGSTLIGSPTLTCKNGMWLPGLPTCVRSTCTF